MWSSNRHLIVLPALLSGVICATLLFGSTEKPSHRVELADIWDAQDDKTYGSISYGTGRYWPGDSDDDRSVPLVVDCGMMANECNLNPTGADFYARKMKRMAKQQQLHESLAADDIDPPAREDDKLQASASSTESRRTTQAASSDASEPPADEDIETQQRNQPALQSIPEPSMRDYSNYWHDGWQQRWDDIHRYPRVWDKGFNGYKEMGEDIDREGMRSTLKPRQGKPLGWDGFQKDPYAKEHPDGIDGYDLYREHYFNGIDFYKDYPKVTDGMTENPPTWKGYGSKEHGTKGWGTLNNLVGKGGSRKPASHPPWCDPYLGCQPPYDKDGSLKWNTAEDDYPTVHYRTNQF